MENESSTTFNLDKKKLRSLLKIGLEKSGAKSTSRDREKAQIWHDVLSRYLPIDESQLEMLPDILADFSQTLGLLKGEKLSIYLRDRKTDLSTIENVKHYAKILSRKSKSDKEHAAANTLYYAAIAHALLYHKTKITELSYAQLAKAFDKLHKLDWIKNYYTQLFTLAWKYCQKKQG
jgi:hypothetical protein